MKIGIEMDSSGSSLLKKQKITDDYVLLSTLDGESSKLAVALSTYELVMFDMTKTVKTLSYKGHEETITGIKFSKENPHNLFSSSLDGHIYMWDMRQGLKPAQTYLDNTELKPITCFDYNVDEKYICGGTQLVRQDAFLIFWDCRKSKCLGGYWDSHTDEITNVQFHSSSDSALASSSVDGLVNIYNVSQTQEEDALINTLNADTSVINFSWGELEQISLITGTEDYQYWNTEKTNPTLTCNRTDLSEKFQHTIEYLIGVSYFEGSSYLATGSNDGAVQLFHQDKDNLNCVGTLVNGHEDIVRTFSICKDNCYVTGGEDGNLCIWNSL